MMTCVENADSHKYVKGKWQQYFARNCMQVEDNNYYYAWQARMLLNHTLS